MQTVNEFAIALGWRNNRSDDAFKYSANIIFSHFGFSKSVNKSIGNKGLGDNRFALSVTGETNHRSDLNFGADARFEYLGRDFPELEYIMGTPIPPEYLKHTDGMGLITISPFARYAKDKLSARVGANVQFSMSDGPSVRISPNVRLSYAASSAFAIELKATGGKSITTLSQLSIQFHDFLLVKKHLLRSQRISVKDIALFIGADIHPVNICFSIFNPGKAFLDTALSHTK